jgi:hypothetical protein
MDNPKKDTYFFHRYPKTTLILAAFLGCLLVAILMELVARTMSDRWAPTREDRNFWRYDPLLGWSHRPDQRGRLHHMDFTIEVAINSQGLRDVEYPVKRTWKKRMVILGDSFGWGFGVEHRDCVSKIIEREHSEWEVINASVSGYSTDQEYLYLKERGIRFKPDVVVLLFDENDFSDNDMESACWHFKPYFIEHNGIWELRNNPVPMATLGQRADRFFIGRTYILKYLYLAVIRWYYLGYYHLRSLVKHHPQRDISVREQEPEKTFAATAYLLGSINRLCIENNAKFILVSIPMDKSKRAWMEDFAQREKISYLALDPYFESKERQTTFAHDKHWNPIGHQIAANAINDFLKEIKVF